MKRSVTSEPTEKRKHSVKYCLLDTSLEIWKDCSDLYFFGLFNRAQSFKQCKVEERKKVQKF